VSGGATANGGRIVRKRSLRAVAVVLGLAAAAVFASLALEVALDPAPVVVPPALGAGMIRCPSGGGLSEFFIDRFEVTAGEYRAFLLATGRKQQPGETSPADSWVPPGTLPAIRVTLFDARAFAEWRGKRIPTSPEWDWAARGQAGFEYPWGYQFSDTFANTAELGLWKPTSVGTFFNGQTKLGVYDMVGNVWEWTDSRAPGFIQVRYILRGGSFLSSGYDAMEASLPSGSEPGDDAWSWPDRGRAELPDRSANDIGFRCVADAAAVDRDLLFREALGRLGGRDPIRVLFQVRPALAKLAVPEARRVLSRSLAINTDPLVRSRIEDLLAHVARDP
jgi:hypothetical protein